MCAAGYGTTCRCFESVADHQVFAAGPGCRSLPPGPESRGPSPPQALTRTGRGSDEARGSVNARRFSRAGGCFIPEAKLPRRASTTGESVTVTV